MLQIIQHQKSGTLSIENLPVPKVKKGFVLVRNYYSLISAGTERTSVETAQASMLGKAKARPDLVKQVLANAKREGFIATYNKVKSRLDSIKELGYSSAGIVIESGTSEFSPGDRVACAGAGYASHAEIICVPRNLIAKVPDFVGLDEAAFTTVAAIALQGVRQADVRVGEVVAVVGLGLIGLITVQILKASGCRVVGLDISTSNFKIAKKLGCDYCSRAQHSSIKAIESFTNGYGTDSVIITAATKSSEPIELALHFARKKSNIVIVGAIGMDIPRSPFYEKELDLRIACSYGPGRYDSSYEEEGNDYPIGYVRWTENRNMQAFLDLSAQKKIDVLSLVTHRIPIRDALKAYDIITGKKQERYLGVLIEYPDHKNDFKKDLRINVAPRTAKLNQNSVVGFVGAGNFAQAYLLPLLKEMNLQLRGVATIEPVSARSVAEKYQFDFCSTDAQEVLNDPEIDAVFIATRHDSHAQYVIKALQNQKHVYVEKPLAVSEEELVNVRKAYQKFSVPKGLCVLTGFNRRFSRPFQEIKAFFDGRQEPMFITYRVNAGFIPKTHWIQSPEQGGRIIGEGCHFIDCMSFLTDARPVQVYARSIVSPNIAQNNQDTIAATIAFSDGSIGTFIYLANGDSSVDKEYCEVSSQGKTALMQNFKAVDLFEQGTMKRKKYDGLKGHREEVEHFISAVQGKNDLAISFDSMYLTTLTTFRIIESLRKRRPLDV
jgi:predicted dehydrogenase/threonine dehydrogenase-like Zn-dependent dehydrogenase